MINVSHLLSDGRRESKASDDSFLLSGWVMLSMRSTHISITLPNNWSIWWGDIDDVEDIWTRRRRENKDTNRRAIKYRKRTLTVFDNSRYNILISFYWLKIICCRHKSQQKLPLMLFFCFIYPPALSSIIRKDDGKTTTWPFHLFRLGQQCQKNIGSDKNVKSFRVEVGKTKLLDLRMLPFANPWLLTSRMAWFPLNRHFVVMSLTDCAEKTETKGARLTFWLHSEAIWVSREEKKLEFWSRTRPMIPR